jgi:hypothetical protein
MFRNLSFKRKKMPSKVFFAHILPLRQKGWPPLH